VQAWYDNDYDRQATAEWLEMTQSALDKELVRVRQALRRELATVERGYFEPDSPWYGVISRLVASYDAGTKRTEREAAKTKWTSPLRARVAAERQARREGAKREARMDPEAARLLAEVEARLAALPDDGDPPPFHLTRGYLNLEVSKAA
jgi:hypothetical protein